MDPAFKQWLIPSALRIGALLLTACAIVYELYIKKPELRAREGCPHSNPPQRRPSPSAPRTSPASNPLHQNERGALRSASLRALPAGNSPLISARVPLLLAALNESAHQERMYVYGPQHHQAAALGPRRRLARAGLSLGPLPPRPHHAVAAGPGGRVPCCPSSQVKPARAPPAAFLPGSGRPASLRPMEAPRVA